MSSVVSRSRTDPGPKADPSPGTASAPNLDPDVVDGFSDEWTRFDQSKLREKELRQQFDQYFDGFPWDALPRDALVFDAGCGTGRWAKLVARRVGRLHCVDPGEGTLAAARRNLAGLSNCEFHLASVGDLPFDDESMDMGYSLGVLHHIPDPAAGLRACVRTLKRGAPFALYIYYAFDNRPPVFRAIWRVADLGRRFISRLPFPLRYGITQPIALFVYWPLARLSLLLERLGLDVAAFPLSGYRHRSFYSMRTDALDRFGTRLERRFTRDEIRRMMEDAGLERIRFSDEIPHWCAHGFRA
jgi:ubiquinone/menaquinone biosynthesis C-methylase UbiE